MAYGDSLLPERGLGQGPGLCRQRLPPNALPGTLCAIDYNDSVANEGPHPLIEARIVLQQQNHAGPALLEAATEPRAGKPEMVAQRVEQARVAIRHDLDRVRVEGKGNRSHVNRDGNPPWRRRPGFVVEADPSVE